MIQDDFYREIVRLIGCHSREKNPINMAFALYGHMKQHPDNVKVDKAWGEMLRNIKILLFKYYDWDMAEIHMFFVKLKQLTQYMKKST